jgi:HK97 family phage portal protein
MGSTLMDVLARLFGGSLQASYGPTDDFWYQPAGGRMTATGLRIDSDQAKTVSAWFRGRALLGFCCGMIPFPAYKRLPDGGREPIDITVGDVVGRKPNVAQNSFDWRQQRVFHLIDFGNSYDLIVPGSRGFLDQLWPIHPSLVTPKQLDSRRVVYDVRDPKTSRTTTYTQDDVFHMRINADDGVVGKGILDYARESLGLSLAQQTYAGAVYGRGAMHGGVVKVAGLLDDEASKRMARSIVDSTAGPSHWHMPWIAEQGAEWIPNTMTPENAQMLLSRQHSVDEVARWLGVPRLMLENNDPSFGNAAQFNQNFVTFSMGSWLSLFESNVNDQLIIQTDTYYMEFVRDALVRGDIEKRWQAYQVAVMTGTYTRNEVRELENRNKLPGLDEPIDPAFLKGSQAGGSQNAPKNPASAKAEAIALESAARVLRKEIAAVQKYAVRFAADQDGFVGAVTAFYDNHADLVAATLVWSIEQARQYCASQAAQIVTGDWIAALGTWHTDDYAAGLAALALEEVA